MMDEEWGPWIEHDGKGCPCVGKVVCVVSNTGDNLVVVAGRECLKDGFDPSGPGSAWVWTDFELNIAFAKCVICYRIRKPEALRELIDMAENLPVKEDA